MILCVSKFHYLSLTPKSHTNTHQDGRIYRRSRTNRTFKTPIWQEVQNLQHFFQLVSIKGGAFLRFTNCSHLPPDLTAASLSQSSTHKNPFTSTSLLQTSADDDAAAVGPEELSKLIFHHTHFSAAIRFFLRLAGTLAEIFARSPSRRNCY